IDQRLTRLMPGLSANERATLILRARKERGEEDPAWRLSMPPEQFREFNRLIHLMNACGDQLSAMLLLIEQIISTLEAKLMWAASLALLSEDMKPGRGNHRRLVDDLPDRLAEAIESQANISWGELRCIELVTAEVAEHFGGEHPLKPADAESLAASKVR